MSYSRPQMTLVPEIEKMRSLAPMVALPRVAVIVTCFNYARYVRQALDSIAAQTYGAFSCVVVDDASTDDSAKVIEEWIEDRKDSRFRLIRKPSNSGQTASFSTGLAATDSEFVAFVDADDIWFPQFIQRHIEAHLNRSFPVSVTCSDLIQIDDEARALCGTWCGPTFEENTSDERPAVDGEQAVSVEPGTGSLKFSECSSVKYIRPSYFEYPWTVTSGMVFRRAMLDLIMPKEPRDLPVCSDCYAFVMCHYFTGSLAIGSALGGYRRHGRNSFVSNPVMGTGLACASQTIVAYQTKIVRIMLRHLLEEYDRFAATFPDPSVRGLVRILFNRCLNEKQLVEEPRLRTVLGRRQIFKDKMKTKFASIRRSILRLF